MSLEMIKPPKESSVNKLGLVVLMLGVFYLITRQQDNGIVEDNHMATTPDNPGQEETAEENAGSGGEEDLDIQITEDEEEEGSYYDIEVVLHMKDASTIRIFCDYIDGKSFSGGSVSFYWTNSGVIVVENGDGQELHRFDSDEESVEWGIDGVQSWEINGA